MVTGLPTGFALTTGFTADRTGVIAFFTALGAGLAATFGTGLVFTAILLADLIGALATALAGAFDFLTCAFTICLL